MQADAISPRRSVPAPTLASPAGRLVAGLVAAACLVLLGTAAGLTPAPAGHGTHLALGLPACGWVISYSRPCPTCGMTTAFALLANGRPLDAFLAQPFGSLLAMASSVTFWGSLHVAATGSMLGTLGAKVLQSRVIWWLVAAAGVSWLYKLSTWTPA
ncbi:MAG: DUF2752 domain-containing protein [Phycisphaerales bacterium]|jgi:hypothetical protein